MEKINTPLMAAIEKTRIELNKAEARRKNFKDKGRQELAENCSDLINNIEDQIKMLESLLPTERDMIVGIVNKHIHPDFRKLNNYRGLDYFTQTFKSYE